MRARGGGSCCFCGRSIRLLACAVLLVIHMPCDRVRANAELANLMSAVKMPDFVEITGDFLAWTPTNRWDEANGKSHEGKFRALLDFRGGSRFRLDFQPILVRWLGGPTPYCEESETLIFDGAEWKHLRYSSGRPGRATPVRTMVIQGQRFKWVSGDNDAWESLYCYFPWTARLSGGKALLEAMCADNDDFTIEGKRQGSDAICAVQKGTGLRIEMEPSALGLFKRMSKGAVVYECGDFRRVDGKYDFPFRFDRILNPGGVEGRMRHIVDKVRIVGEKEFVEALSPVLDGSWKVFDEKSGMEVRVEEGEIRVKPFISVEELRRE